MIKNIVIREVATFDNDGVALNDLTKINFIYGGNGTGKTTISNFLSEIDNPKYSACSCDSDLKNINDKNNEITELEDDLKEWLWTQFDYYPNL